VPSIVIVRLLGTRLSVMPYPDKVVGVLLIKDQGTEETP